MLYFSSVVRMRFFLRKVGIDKAIGYVILGRGWSVLSGIMVLFLISKFLSPLAQGYYFTFSSIIALQVMFELGLGSVLVQFASHEMGKLELIDGKIQGDKIAASRLFSLIRLSAKWYSLIALFIVFFISIVGFWFFDNNEGVGATINWELPWFFLVLFSAIGLFITSFISIAEGCGLVIKIAKMRFLQSVASGLFAWGCLLSDHGLYATAATSFGVVLVGGGWIYKNFFSVLCQAFNNSKEEKYLISWKNEIFPMQWRIAISWLSGYFIFQIFNPIAFKFYGPEYAGQLGMSITITNLMLTLALAWITTKIPLFGRLIAQQKYDELNQAYDKTFFQSLIFLLIMIFGSVIFLWIIHHFDLSLSKRVLSINSFSFLCVAMLGNHVVACQATYVRAHKLELYMNMSVLTAVILSTTIYIIGLYYDAELLMPTYAGVTWFVFVPYSIFIYIKFRRQVKNEI